MEFEPYFQLFRGSPLDTDEKKSLASALQAFETALFLVGLGRFPAALIICAGAIESAIKAIPGNPSPNSDGLQAATNYAIKRKPRIQNGQLRRFIERRNEFVHRGHSPAHDGEAVELLFEAGLPFLAACLWEFHKISLKDTTLYEIWKHVEIARKVLGEQKHSINVASIPESNWQIRATKALRHMLNYGFLPTYENRWTDIDVGLPDHEFAARLEAKRNLQHKWEPYEYITCPISSCNSEECLAGFRIVSAHQVNATKLYCFECSLALGENDRSLLKVLISDQLPSIKERINKEYGIT